MAKHINITDDIKNKIIDFTHGDDKYWKNKFNDVMFELESLGRCGLCDITVGEGLCDFCDYGYLPTDKHEKLKQLREWDEFLNEMSNIEYSD